MIEHKQCDVLIAGGGIAGVAAAVAAARAGASVQIIEKSVALGGLATIGLISWYEPLCDGSGKHMTGGIAEELLRLSIKYGFDDLAETWSEMSGEEPRTGRYATHYSPTMFIMALDELLLSLNIKLRFDTLITEPVMENGICLGLICESVSGREYFPTKVVVDATGDATVLHRAGAPTETGDNYMSYVSHSADRAGAAAYANGGKASAFRKWTWAGSTLSGKGHPDGMPMQHGTTGEEVSNFIITGRQMLFEKIKNQDRNERDITMLPAMAQYRKIRRLCGEYDFDGTELDVKFHDAIGSMGDFRNKGRHYQLPYRTLYNRNFPNIFAAGRIISATGEGWEITRVIPVAALSGHAAGAAAALCAAESSGADKIDIIKLQKMLKDSGVLFR